MDIKSLDRTAVWPETTIFSQRLRLLSVSSESFL